MRPEEAAALLREKDRILLVTHRNPDGDTMGSAAALCSGLRRLGKTAWLYPNPQVIAKLLPFVAPFYAPEDFVPGFIVSVDVATEKMFAEGYAGNKVSAAASPRKRRIFSILPSPLTAAVSSTAIRTPRPFAMLRSWWRPGRTTPA